jgi:hypothetical protein
MMRPVLANALEGKPQDEDRPSTLAACEIIAGLLQSGVCFESQGTHSLPRPRVRGAAGKGCVVDAVLLGLLQA